MYRLLQICSLMLWFACVSAVAGISFDSSRVVFLSSDDVNGQSIGVSSNEETSTPYLVKTQVLGDIVGNKTQTPFSVTPSLFRLEPGTTNQLRILKIGDQVLPQDKESIFYLRVMALPSGQNFDSGNKSELGGELIVSTGSIIKLFYRPTKLSMSQQQGMASLQFSQKGQYLHVTNPSPYYVTLTSLSIDGKAISLSTRKENTMIAPFGNMTYTDANVGSKVVWQSINDFGGLEKFDGTIE